MLGAFPRPWTYGMTICLKLGLPLRVVVVWLLYYIYCCYIWLLYYILVVIYNNQTTTTLRGRPSLGHIVIPYVQGLGEIIKHTYSKFGIQTHFKGNRTLKQILVKPKVLYIRRRRVVSFIVTNVQLWTVGRSILEKHLGPWGRGTRYM